MSEHMYRAICHTRCYWLETLWEVGEVYEGNFKPNKHFSDDGVGAPVPPPTPGEDPRPTVEIRKILKTKYGSEKPKSWPRKKLWAALHEFETSEERDGLTSDLTEHDFIARCGYVSKSNAGKMAHERACAECKGE